MCVGVASWSVFGGACMGFCVSYDLNTINLINI